MAARCLNVLRAEGWGLDPAADVAEGRRLAELAAKTGGEDPTALAVAAYVLAYLCSDPEAAAVLAEDALRLNPNSALAWRTSGFVKTVLGDPCAAIPDIERSLRLSPRDIERKFQLHIMTLALLHAGRFEEAVRCGERAVQGAPNWSQMGRVLAAALIYAGRLEEARRAMAVSVRAAPDLTISRWETMRVAWRDRAFAARLTDAYRLAGMPE